MSIVAINPLMFAPGDDSGVLKSIRLAGVSAGPLVLGALVGEEMWTELGEDADDAASVGATEPELPFAFLLLLFLRLLGLPPLLGWAITRSCKLMCTV